jgi:hypothetical protein
MTDQWRNSGAEGIEAMDRFTGAVPARDALERLLAVAMTEEEDVSAATQDEWIAAIQQANEALAESGHIVVLPPASRLQEAEALLERALYLPSMESEDRDLTLTAIRAFFDDAGVSQERPQPDHDANCGIDPLHSPSCPARRGNPCDDAVCGANAIRMLLEDIIAGRTTLIDAMVKP